MDKISALAARCSLTKWLCLSLAVAMGALIIHDWRELSRAWRDLADLGTEPSVILGSIALGWIHTPSFWVLIGLVGAFSALFWRMAVRHRKSQRKTPPPPFAPIKAASVTLNTKNAPGPLVFGLPKNNPPLRRHG